MDVPSLSRGPPLGEEIALFKPVKDFRAFKVKGIGTEEITHVRQVRLLGLQRLDMLLASESYHWDDRDKGEHWRQRAPGTLQHQCLREI